MNIFSPHRADPLSQVYFGAGDRLAAARPQDREYRANLARSRRHRQHRLHRSDRERHIDPSAPYDRTSRLRPRRANAGWPHEPCGLNAISAAGTLARQLSPRELGMALRKLGSSGSGAGTPMLAFTLYGIQPNKPMSGFRALSIARSKPRHVALDHLIACYEIFKP
jgi:hypothetical protein